MCIFCTGHASWSNSGKDASLPYNLYMVISVVHHYLSMQNNLLHDHLGLF